MATRRFLTHPPQPARLRAAARRWVGDRRGAAMLEFAFLMPVMVLVLAGIIQFGMALYLRSSMLDTAQDAARRMAVGDLTTPSEVTSFVHNTMKSWVTPSVAAAWPDPSAGQTDVSVTLTVPMSDAVPFDLLGLFDTATMPASAVMRMEGL